MRHVNRNSVPRATALLSWQEALAILEGCDERGVPIPFAIAFCTCDESRHTGGEIIRYDKAVWHVAGGRVQKTESFERVGGKPVRTKTPKSNWTRLIRGFDTDQPRQIHLHLILEINGQPVR
ncbi:hypothetical protein [Spirosoma areae]